MWVGGLCDLSSFHVCLWIQPSDMQQDKKKDLAPDYSQYCGLIIDERKFLRSIPLMQPSRNSLIQIVVKWQAKCSILINTLKVNINVYVCYGSLPIFCLSIALKGKSFSRLKALTHCWSIDEHSVALVWET